MQVFKTYFKVLKKSYGSMLLYVGIICSLIVMFSSMGVSNGGTAFDSKKYNIVVKDNDNTSVSKAFKEYLSEIHNVKTEEYTEEQLKNLLFGQRIVAVITIPEEFGENFLSGDMKYEILQDEALPMGEMIAMQADSYLGTLKKYMSAGFTEEESIEKAATAQSTEGLVSMVNEDEGVKDNTGNVFRFLPYGIITVIFSGILPILFVFKDDEVEKRIAVSSEKPRAKLLELLGGSTVLALAVFVLLIAIVSILNPTSFLTREWFLYVLNAFIIMVTVCMVMGLVATIPFKGKDANQQASMFTNIVALSFSFLGGIFVPMEYMGEGVKSVGRFLPTYWYSEAVQKITDGASLSSLWSCFGLQLAFGICAVTVALILTKISANTKNA